MKGKKSDPLIIKIGNAGKGGWWCEAAGQFEDGFESEELAIAAAAARIPGAWEVWYEVTFSAVGGRKIMLPGPLSPDHPENPCS